MSKARQSLRKNTRRGAPANGAKGPKVQPGSFPIVGVGASAGGLEAFERLLKRLPANTGMAFVLVQHLDPKHESQLKTIFSRATSMPVAEVTDGMRLEPNHVYIIAPKTTLLLEDGVLRLVVRRGSKNRYRAGKPSGFPMMGTGETVGRFGELELAAANRALQQELSRRHQAEEESRGSEERFMLIADAMPDPFSFVDANQCYQFCNEAFERWFGVSRRQLKGLRVKDVIGAAAYETKKPYLEKALEGQRTCFEGYIAYKAEVGRRFMHVDYIPARDRGVEGCYIFAHDLSELKTVEEQLRSFAESAPDAMIVVNAKEEIILANQQAERVFGYTREEMLGRDHQMLIPAALHERHAVHHSEYLGNPTARLMGTGLELHGVRKDGTEFPAEISLSPIRTREGLVVSSIIRDVTERKRLELARRHEAILKERNRLARDVHDNLAQGLTSIVLQLEGCEQVLTQNPRQAQKHIERARSVARSSLEEARRSLVAMHAQILHETSLPDAIEQIISDLRQESSARIELSVRGIPYALPIATQEHLLRVTQEALRNAIRHAKANAVRVEIAYDRDAVGIRIEDNGQGFSVRKVRGGLGLGLTIMRERASEIGANFDLRSQPGKGTRVAVRMPIPPDTSKRPA